MTTTTPVERTPARYSRGQILAYGLPGLPLAGLGVPLFIFLPAFYAQNRGLSLEAVGFALLLARLWDAVSDPLIGMLSDRIETRFGWRKPWFFAGTMPNFRPETYFAGQSRSWGMFEGRFGNLKREYLQGDWDGSTLTLTEDFDYANGETKQRVWRITKTGDEIYEGRADDAVGIANGIARGKALNWSYDLMLNIDDSRIKVRFDD